MWWYVVLGLVLLVLMARAPQLGATAQKVVERWRPLVERQRQYYPAVPASWALAVICQESAGDPSAVNPERDPGPFDDSVGLFQITDPVVVDFNLATGKRYDFSMLQNPEINVELGMWNLNRHLKRFGDIRTAVRAHNGGAGGVTLAATADYLARVERFQQQISRIL